MMTYSNALNFGIQAMTVLAIIMPPFIAVKASKINETGESTGMRVGKSLIFAVTLIGAILIEKAIAPEVTELLASFLKSVYSVL